MDKKYLLQTVNKTGKREQLQQAYKAGRNNLLLVVIFTVVNVFLALTGSNTMFLFSGFFPYIAAISSTISAIQNFQLQIIGLCCVLPIALCLLCYLLSAKEQRYGFLGAATALFIADTVYLIGYIIKFGFDTSFTLTIVFHALVLWQLFKGLKAGRELSKMPPEDMATEEKQDDNEGVREPLEGETNDEEIPESPAAYYPYNASHASRNTAGKAIELMLTVVLYLLIGVGATTATAIYMIDSNEIPFEAGIAVTIAVFATVTGIMIWRMVKLSPYLEAKTTSFIVDDNGVLSRRKNELVTTIVTRLENIRIVEESKECWVVSYINKKGADRKMVIPKAYPGLEGYMNNVPRL